MKSPRAFLVFLVAFAGAVALSATLPAADAIWSAAIAAENKPRPEFPAQLARFQPAVADVFGYNSATLLGIKKQPIRPGRTEWLLPTNDYYFQITCRKRDEDSYWVLIEMFAGKRQLFEAEAKLGKQEPLLIKGPQAGSTQDVLILWVE